MTFQQHFGRILKQIFRRKSYPSIFAAACFLLIFVVRDIQKFNAETSASTFKSEIHSSHLSQVKFIQDDGKSKTCDNNVVVLASQLDSRPAWSDDPKCSIYQISHMIPHCRKPIALASYPGSGNTWLRFLIEGAGGVFTGSRYKDLQIQMFGFWGEIRNWQDGTTIVQKTHDASKNHVLQDFGGRAVLVLRNPYEAILSTHNFLYAGHHGKAPIENFSREDWHQFLTVQASKWLDMATNWTIHSKPEEVLVLHYENLKSDLKSEIRRVLNFLRLPIDESRLDCMSKYSGGLFRRTESKKSELVIPFSTEIRRQMDNLIRHVDAKVLRPRGYPPMPLEKYKFFEKTDEEILKEIELGNEKMKIKPKEKDDYVVKVDRVHGTQMVLNEYIKYLENEDKIIKKNGSTALSDDTATLIMRNVYEMLGKPKDQESLTKIYQKAEGILSMAVEWWPTLQRPFAKDPIKDAIETDGFRGSEIKDITLPE